VLRDAVHENRQFADGVVLLPLMARASDSMISIWEVDATLRGEHDYLQ